MRRPRTAASYLGHVAQSSRPLDACALARGFAASVVDRRVLGAAVAIRIRRVNAQDQEVVGRNSLRADENDALRVDERLL